MPLSNDELTQITRQLNIIKWLLALGSVSVFAIAIFLAGAGKFLQQQLVKPNHPSSFEDQAQKLLDVGKPAEALSLAEQRLELAPNDSRAYWYIGLAYYQMEKWDQAIDAFRKAQELSPSWERAYTGPYIKAAEKKRQSGKSSEGDANPK